MTREKFLELAGQLYDAQAGNGGDPRPPKFDTRLNVGNGEVVWASECSLKELNYHKARADKPPSDPKYAASNAAKSKSLSYWVSYRQGAPMEQWRGERDRATVYALPPSDKPQKYSKDAPPVSAPQVAAAGAPDDDDIPFMRVPDHG